MIDSILQAHSGASWVQLNQLSIGMNLKLSIVKKSTTVEHKWAKPEMPKPQNSKAPKLKVQKKESPKIRKQWLQKLKSQTAKKLQIHPTKAPGLDMTAKFFQKYWLIAGGDIKEATKQSYHKS